MGREKTGWSERVRELARRDYVDPARGAELGIRIPFGEFKAKLVRMGFPSSHANQVATPLESKKFWRPLGLELISPKGQPRTVDSILEFRFTGEANAAEHSSSERKERAMGAFERLRGLMKKEIAAHGGAEEFIRWVRSDDDEDAA